MLSRTISCQFSLRKSIGFVEGPVTAAGSRSVAYIHLGYSGHFLELTLDVRLSLPVVLVRLQELSDKQVELHNDARLTELHSSHIHFALHQSLA